MTKTCTKCGADKDVDLFYKDKRHKSGLASECKVCHNALVADNTKRNKKRKKETNRLWHLRNRDRILARQAKYRKSHKDQILARKMIKYHTDANFRVKETLRSRICAALKGVNKSAATMRLLGCTWQEFMHYMEKQFVADMSWENYGKWHIDHIKPCKSFDLTKESEQYECFNYSNLQPLWAEENLSKGCSY